MLPIEDRPVVRQPVLPPKQNTVFFQGSLSRAVMQNGNANPVNNTGSGNGTNQTQATSNPGTGPNLIPPAVTVSNAITGQLNPVLAPAQKEADDAQARLNAGKKQLDALYADMDSRGASAAKLDRAKKLEEQQAADQKAFDAANAKVSALKTATYSEQLKADQATAAGSKKTADQAFADLNTQLPPTLGFKQGDELTDQQIAKLTPEQRAAYFRYVQAQSQAVNDQNKVNATTLELNRNYTQWQIYASDPGKYGDIADQGLKAVNDALKPLNLEMRGPEKIDPKTAAQNLAEINEIAPYYFAVWETSSAAVKAMHDVLGAQITLADKQAALAKWQRANPYMMAPGNSYEQAVDKAKQDLIAAQQKAQPLMLDYGVKAAYSGKLATQLELKQAQADQQTAQTNYNQWRSQFPYMAAPGNPLELALNEANRKLTIAQQRASTADVTLQAATAQKDAYALEQDARRIWIQANGDAICIGSKAQNVTAAYTAADDKAKAARTNADKLTLQAQKSGLELQKLLAQEDVRLKQLAVSNAQPAANGSDIVLVSYDTNASGQPLAGGTVLAQAKANLQQSETQLANIEYAQKMAQYDIERYDFLAGLPENLKNPQTDNDKEELQTKLAEFEKAHFAFLRENQFKYGPINDQEALKQVRMDLEAERNKINSRGWMQSSADGVTEFFGGDRSELETFLGDNEHKLSELVAKKGTMSEDEYQTKLHAIMDPYGTEFVRMTLGEENTDDRWHTVNEVSRFATATIVGIAATVAGGGVNVLAGAAAAFAVYEAWDIGDDVTAAAHGGDMMADGHLSISGFSALAITNAMGKTDQDMGDAAMMAGQDLVMNTVSSLAVGAGAGAGRITALAAGKWLTPLAARAVPALGVRGASLATDMVSTSAGHTVSQVALGTGQEVNTGVDLAFRGKLFTAEGGQALTDQAKNQGVYLLAAPVVGFVSGGIPRVALVRQASFDLGANFAQEELRTQWTEGRDINDNEAIAALIGTVPGTAMNLVARRGAQPVNPPGKDLVLTTNHAPGTDISTVPRYIAHFDTDGSPSLGLLDADGVTTANVDAPWQGAAPARVEVVETSIGADGKLQTDAAHVLTRNADGSYSGVRIDSDGGVTHYTTGAAGAGHPLTGIQLRNASRLGNPVTDSGTTTAGRTQTGNVTQPGTDVVPVVDSGQAATNGQPGVQTVAFPTNTGVVNVTNTSTSNAGANVANTGANVTNPGTSTTGVNPTGNVNPLNGAYQTAGLTSGEISGLYATHTDAETGTSVPVVAPGKKGSWSTALVLDPATGQPVEVRVDPRYAGRVKRLSDDNGVIPESKILRLDNGQSKAPSGTIPQWLVLSGADGTPTLYPLNRVGILGKRGLPGVDPEVAKQAARAVRNAYWQSGVNLARKNAGVIVLAAVGAPVAAFASPHAGVFMAAAIIPPLGAGGGKKFGDWGRKTLSKLNNMKRNILYYSFMAAGAVTMFTAPAMARGFDPMSIRVHNYIDLMIRGAPLAMVAFTAAKATRLRWGGTQMKGMTLRLINGITFTQNGLLTLSLLAFATPANPLAQISLAGFGAGQFLLGVRTLLGARQSRKFGTFMATTSRADGKTNVLGEGGTAVPQKGRKLTDVAATEQLNIITVAIGANPKFKLDTSHTVRAGQDWDFVALETGYSVPTLKEFNPTLGNQLRAGDQVYYPTPEQVQKLLRQGAWKWLPGGRKVRGASVELPAPGGVRKLTGTKGLPWSRFAHERGTSDVPLLILNRDAQLAAMGQTKPAKLVFSRSRPVQSGQTWLDMAAEFGTSVERLREFNPQINRDLQDGDTVYYPTRDEINALRTEMGDTILTDSITVPVAGAARLRVDTTATKGPGVLTENTYTAASKMTGVPKRVLQILNGDRLYLVGKNAGTYKVREGEDWAKVAKNLGVSEADLHALNGSVAGNPLTKNQEIKVPTVVDIPKNATWDWVETTIRMHGASRRQSLEMTSTLSAGKLELSGSLWTYSVAPGGESLPAIAQKLNLSEADLTQRNGRVLRQLPAAGTSGQPVVIPQGTRLNVPNQLPIPANADLAWIDATLASVNADLHATLARTSEMAEIITKPEIRVPAYSFEGESQASRWLQVVGTVGIATGSGTIAPVDWGRWGAVKPLQLWLTTLNGGNALAAATTSVISAAPHREKGTVAKRLPWWLAPAQMTAGLTLGARAATRLSALAGWLGNAIKTIARNNP